MTYRHTLDWRDQDCLYVREDVSIRNGANPLHTCLVLKKESNARSDAMNKNSSATGIGQEMKDRNTGLYYGYTREQFVDLGVRGQLPFFRNRYVRNKGKVSTMGRNYGVTAAPAAVSLKIDEDEPIYAAEGKTRFSQKADGSDTQASYLANASGWDPLGLKFISLRTMALGLRSNLIPDARFYEFVERVTGSPYPLDDFYDPMQRASVFGISPGQLSQWQGDHGLFADGEMGPKTCARMIMERELMLAREARVEDIVEPVLILPEKPFTTFEQLTEAWPRRDYLDIES